MQAIAMADRAFMSTLSVWLRSLASRQGSFTSEMAVHMNIGRNTQTSGAWITSTANTARTPPRIVYRTVMLKMITDIHASALMLASRKRRGATTFDDAKISNARTSTKTETRDADTTRAKGERPVASDSCSLTPARKFFPVRADMWVACSK